MDFLYRLLRKLFPLLKAGKINHRLCFLCVDKQPDIVLQVTYIIVYLMKRFPSPGISPPLLLAGLNVPMDTSNFSFDSNLKIDVKKTNIRGFSFVACASFEVLSRQCFYL